MKANIRKIFSLLDICYQKVLMSIRRGVAKNKFSKFNGRGKKQSESYQEVEDVDLYSLNRYQLKNLTDKNIYFGFFQLEDFSFGYDKAIENLLSKARRVREEELLLNLKDQDLKQPLVLICDKGFISRATAQKLRDQGFVNVYFIEGGLKALLEAKE